MDLPEECWNKTSKDWKDALEELPLFELEYP
jgi:hypothetical protein